MAEPFKCEIVTPASSVFEAEATFVVIPGAAGEMGVYAKHAPTVTTLKPGGLKVVLEDGKEILYAVSGGYAEVDGDQVIVLANRATDVAEHDASSVRDEISRLQGELGALDDGDPNGIPLRSDIEWYELIQHLLERN
ncbi:MAG: ATP synthase F1 subunit epsilon [Coriobacteriales bacterium]|jgi:F-type H+-transporting ATPase subunit epsilon